MHRWHTRARPFLGALLAMALLVPGTAHGDPLSDFDDGTTQGWTKVLPFGGRLLTFTTGGNPGGFIAVDDTVAGGGGLYLSAPPEFTGDLSIYAAILWDENLEHTSPPPGTPSYPILVGADGTRYRPISRVPIPLEAWRARGVRLEAQHWELVFGTASFEDVLANVAELWMDVDCNAQYGREVGLDNIRLSTTEAPPEPSPTYSVVGCVGICPAGDLTFDVYVNDPLGSPIDGAVVEVSFAACDSVRLCAPDPLDDYWFVPGRFTVAMLTDAGGLAHFAIRGGGVSAGRLAEIRAEGVLLATTSVRSPDLNGDLAVYTSDYPEFMSRYGTYDAVADFNCDGLVDPADLATFLAHFNGHPNPNACPAAEYTLTVSVDGPGAVTKDPDRTQFDHGETVRLTAVPDPGADFETWSGDAGGSENPLDLLMDGNKSVTANFGGYTLTVNVVGQGTVTKTPDLPSYAPGSTVDLDAQPAVGWHFVAWSGDLAGTDPSTSILMDADHTVTATFEINRYPLTVNVAGSGTVTRNPDQALYDHGTTVQLTAVPATCWLFQSWSGDASGPANPTTVLMDTAKTVTATFFEPTAISAGHSTVPAYMTLTGTVGGTADAAEAFTVVTRTAAGCPVEGATVRLVFTGCPDVQPAGTQPWPGVSINCGTRVVSKQTDASGEAQFVVVGSVQSRASNGVPGCVQVRADPGDVLLGSMTVNVYDHDFRDGVRSQDIYYWLCDFFMGMNPVRSDYNHASGVTAADLSLYLGYFLSDRRATESGARCDGIPVASRVFTTPDSGLRLGWGDCDGGGGSRTLVLPCDSNSGELTPIVGSVVLPEWTGYRDLVAFEAVVDLVTELGRPTPDWWRVDAAGCRNGAFTIEFPDPQSCVDPGVTPFGSTIRTEYPYGAPNVTRLWLGGVLGNVYEATAGEEISLFALRLSPTKTVGPGACEGCQDSAMLVFRSIEFFQNSGACVLPTATDSTLRILRGQSTRAWVAAHGPVGVDVPAGDFASRLALRLAGSNPVSGALRIGLAAPDRGTVTVDVLDVGGRVIERHEVLPAGGEQVLTLGSGRRLAPGIYFVRAQQAGESVRLKAVALR